VFSKARETLLADGNIQDAFAIINILKDYAPNLPLTFVRDSTEALDCLFGTGGYKDRSTPYTPQLILLDVNLPEMGGVELLKIIRSYKRTSAIPVVMLGCAAEEKVINQSYEQGVNSYIV
jgi:two-component system, response regulator